jgi:hypothetical protein
MFEKTTSGEWAVLGLSVITAIIATLSRPLDSGAFGITFILSLIILYIIYWVITNVLYPKSQNWGVILWGIAIVGILIILAIIAAFMYGLV